ncbi:MAG TPA: CBS domain-containing protein, partial [Chloroflexota bacterium]|nr:CBS domain-containing protein [Chloroflexota bacterium]
GFVLPDGGPGFWPLLSMGAILGGTMRSPFTGMLFIIELTHDLNLLLPLLIAVTAAHGFTVLVLRRSILTEKVSRRGYHLTREYAIDPLEILFVREAMRTNILALPGDITPAELAQRLRAEAPQRGQRLFPVVGAEGHLLGVVTAQDLRILQRAAVNGPAGRPLADLVRTDPVVAYPDEPLRAVVYRMAETGLTRFPVVERGDRRKLVGMISLNDLLKARRQNLEAERRRERVLRLRLRLPRRERALDQQVVVERPDEAAMSERR